MPCCNKSTPQYAIDPMGRDQPNSREKMHDFTAKFLKCVKFNGKSFANSQAPQTLFQGAALLQTKKFQNNEYLLHLVKTQDSQCQLLSAEVRHVANSNIRTKAADKTLGLS